MVRSRVLSIRLSVEERERLNALAKQAGTPIPTLIRRALGLAAEQDQETRRQAYEQGVDDAFGRFRVPVACEACRVLEVDVLDDGVMPLLCAVFGDWHRADCPGLSPARRTSR